MLAIGLLSMFHPMLLSAFGRLQTDPGDTLLNAYILEHSWLWLTKPDYVGTFWSPAFFHPQPLVLTYSENLLGTAPLYWALRLACPPILAFQLWTMLVTSLTYVSFAAVLRRFGSGHVLAALGGFVFAFGMPRIAQVGHQQLLAHVFAPWAMLAAWRFAERPALGSLTWTLATSFLQLLASVYLGWLTLLALGIFACVLFAVDREARRQLAGFCRRLWLPAIGLIAVWLGLLALLALPYREANRDFRRPYAEVLSLTPRPSNWLSPAPQSVWSQWLPQESQPELWIFPGAIVVAGCGLALAFRQTRPFAITAIVLAILATRWGDWSAWRAVFRWAPGGEAIRAVGRVVFAVEMFGLVGGLVALDGLLRRIRCGSAFAGLVLAFGIVEQLPVHELPSFEIVPWRVRVDAIKRQLTPGNVAYVEIAPDRPYWESQLTAMWAGLEANVPMVNGYSGRYPLGYPDWSRTMTEGELKQWSQGASVARIPATPRGKP